MPSGTNINVHTQTNISVTLTVSDVVCMVPIALLSQKLMATEPKHKQIHNSYFVSDGAPIYIYMYIYIYEDSKDE